MKKYLTLIFFTVCFYAQVFSQNPLDAQEIKKIDSLTKLLSKLKGRERIDCLIRIVDAYQIWDDENQMQIDKVSHLLNRRMKKH